MQLTGRHYKIIEHDLMDTVIELDDGKYTLIYSISGGTRTFKCLRYGEEWRDVMGDNLIYWLMCAITDGLSENNIKISGGKKV